MYIRRTHTANTATGDRYYTYRLVRSERIAGKVKQKTLLNLGRHFPVEQDHWPSLCARIDEVLSGQQSLIPLDLPVAVERQAQRIAAQLLAREGKETPQSLPEEGDIQSVDVDSMDLIRPRTVGVEQAALWAMQQVDFVGILKEQGFTGPQQSAALGSIIGRMCKPASELATSKWLGEHSGLGELLDVDYEAMELSQLYRVSDRLYRCRAVLERALFDQVSTLFGLSSTITLFDLTNTFFEGTAEGNAKAQHGRSKEKRSDCPLVTLGMVLDGSGFVRRSEVFSGNVSEGKTLAKMLEGLEAPQGALVIRQIGASPRKRIFSGCGSKATVTWW